MRKTFCDWHFDGKPLFRPTLLFFLLHHFDFSVTKKLSVGLDNQNDNCKSYFLIQFVTIWANGRIQTNLRRVNLAFWQIVDKIELQNNVDIRISGNYTFSPRGLRSAAWIPIYQWNKFVWRNSSRYKAGIYWSAPDCSLIPAIVFFLLPAYYSHIGGGKNRLREDKPGT